MGIALSYRREPLDNWRKMYYDRYKPLLDSLYTGNDMVEAVNVLARHFKRTNLFVLTTEYRMPHLGAVSYRNIW